MVSIIYILYYAHTNDDIPINIQYLSVQKSSSPHYIILGWLSVTFAIIDSGQYKFITLSLVNSSYYMGRCVQENYISRQHYVRMCVCVCLSVKLNHKLCILFGRVCI